MANTYNGVLHIQTYLYVCVCVYIYIYLRVCVYVCVCVCMASQVVVAVKNPPANAGGIRDADSTPGSERSPGEGQGNQLQYSFLKTSVDRGAWWAAVCRVAKSQIKLKQISTQRHRQTNTYTHHILCIHSCIDGSLHCFQVLAIISKATISMRYSYFFKMSVFISFKYPKIECMLTGRHVAGIYVNSVFNFLRNPHIFYHSDCLSLHSHQQCTRFFSPYLCQHLIFLLFLIIAILTSVR